MHKELNPDLFSDKSKPKTATTGDASLRPSDTAQMSVDRQIFELKIQNHNLSEQLNKLTAAFAEMNKNASIKFERNQQILGRLEQSQSSFAYETSQKFNQVGQKISERKIVDAKIQDMVDRHSNIVKSFEVRMNHMQKMLAEKETLASAMHTSLNEARMEIARLKRP